MLNAAQRQRFIVKVTNELNNYRFKIVDTFLKSISNNHENAEVADYATVITICSTIRTGSACVITSSAKMIIQRDVISINLTTSTHAQTS